MNRAQSIIARVLECGVERGDVLPGGVAPITGTLCALLSEMLHEPQMPPDFPIPDRRSVLALYTSNDRVTGLDQFLDPDIPIGQRIRAQRLALNWSRPVLAEYVGGGATETWIRSIELGARLPPYPKLARVCETLGIPLVGGRLDQTGAHRYFTAGFRAGKAEALKEARAAEFGKPHLVPGGSDDARTE